jgi:hypothetical protein
VSLASTHCLRLLSALPLVLALCACWGREDKPQENVLPTNYKPDILEMLHGSLEDPTNVRDAAISEPVLKPVAGSTRYVVCLRFNARDSSGQYTGMKNLAAVYFSGRITQLINSTDVQCGGVAFQPFPELQKLCREIVCPKRA